jgi:hypothetical protein
VKESTNVTQIKHYKKRIVELITEEFLNTVRNGEKFTGVKLTRQ